MKTVLCYGDSITWGFNPVDGSWFPFEQRWPGVLQAVLGSSWRVIEEGLNGRTVATESWILPNRDGRSMLTPLLDAASLLPPGPVDGVHPDADGQRRLGEATAKVMAA
jgi:lysophospholipase L1-like esterase